MSPELNYEALGATRPGDATWAEHPLWYRQDERTVPIGRGHDQWRSASSTVMAWGVKTRGGFKVQSVGDPNGQVRLGADYRLLASLDLVALNRKVTQLNAEIKGMRHENKGHAKATGDRVAHGVNKAAAAGKRGKR